MATVRYPTPLHERVLAEILTQARADPGVRGVLLGGSLSRGTARADSDLDILIVTTAGTAAQPLWCAQSWPLPVDFVVRTAGEWRERFAPQRRGQESWGYAFLDGVILDDPEGIVCRLIADAAEIHQHYRVPGPVKAHYAWLWLHVRPKMLAVLGRDDPVEIGWSAAAMTNDLLRTVWAASDLPNPSLDLGTVQRHLDDLTIPPGAPDLLRAILRAPPKETLQRQLDLIDLVLPHLGKPERSVRGHS